MKFGEVTAHGSGGRIIAGARGRQAGAGGGIFAGDGGRFRIEDVLPGDYTIWLRMIRRGGELKILQAEMKFTMPPVADGYDPRPLVIADIQLNWN